MDASRYHARRRAAVRDSTRSRGESMGASADRSLEAGPRFDALISYHAETDRELSGALRRELVRFAKPFWKLRGVRVFRDVESGVGSPDLRKGLRRALRSSRYLILLARPESARSAYVRWELQQWSEGVLERGQTPSDFLLIVRTAGSIALRDSDHSVDWQRTDALPDELDHPWRGVGAPASRLSEWLASTPRIEQLDWACSAQARRARSKEFQGVVAQLCAPLRGVPKDDLESEEIERRRQTIRVVSGTAVVLLALAAFAGLQWGRAERERRAAELATWRERGGRAHLLATSVATQSEALRVGIDAVAPAVSNGVEPPPEAIDGLHSALRAYRQTFGLPALGSPIVKGTVLPDADGAIVGCRGGSLHRFEWQHGRQVATRHGADERGDFVLVASDSTGRLLVTVRAEDPRAEWWSTETLQPLGAWELPVGELCSVAAIDPALGRIAVGSNRGRVHLLSIADRSELRAVDTAPSALVRLAWNTSGDLLACGALDGKLWLVRPQSDEPRLFDVPNGVATCACFTSKSSLAVASNDLVAVHEFEKGEWVQLGRAPQKVSRMLATSDGGYVAAWGFQPTVTLWDLNNGSAPIVLRHAEDVECVAFSPRPPLMLTGTAIGRVQAWDRRSGTLVTSMNAHGDSIEWLSFDAQGRRFGSAGFDGVLRISDLDPRDEHTEWTRHSVRVSGLTCLGSEWLSSGWDATLVEHADPSHSRPRWKHAQGVIGLVVADDRERFATLGFAGDVWIGDRRGASHEIDAHAGNALAAAFVARGSVLVTGGVDGAVRRFSTVDGRALGDLGVGLGRVACIASIDSAQLVVAATGDGGARVWAVSDGRELKRLGAQAEPIRDLVARPGHDEVLSSGGRHALLWNVREATIVRELVTGDAVTDDMDVHPDAGLAAVVRSDKSADLWNLDTGERVANLRSGGQRACCVRFSRAGNLLAVGCDQGEVGLYRARGGEPLMLLQTGSAAGIWALDFSDDERQLLAGDETGRVVAFSLEAGALLRDSRRYLAR